MPAGYPLTKLNRRNSAETALEIAADSERDLNTAFDSGEKVNAVATAIRQAMQDSGIVALVGNFICKTSRSSEGFAR